MIKRLVIAVFFLAQVFIGFSQSSKNINLLSNPALFHSQLTDVWGYANSSGNEYAILGFLGGVSIVDVTDSQNPIEVFFATGVGSSRDIKVWNNHAYITNEVGGGLMIIDLSNLPGAITTADVYSYTGSTYPFNTAHNLFIDENGIAYVVRIDDAIKSTIILDLTINPQNPVEVGRLIDFEYHDVMVRGDTLWGAAIFDGVFTVVDVSDKANSVLLATHFTPNLFTHNCWISDDGQTLYTTDEKSNAFIAAYDVSDLSNIAELDRIQSNPGNSVMPHNTFFINDYVVTSYYNDGVTIHDVSNPNNMIEVGHYDTSPLFSGSTSNGCWGVYPYLPSGIILASDRENGLFILGPTYLRGVELNGTVTNSFNSALLNNVTIDILSSNITTNTNILGDYTTGIADVGMYDVVYSKAGFISDTIINLSLSLGVITTQDVQLTPITTSIPNLNKDNLVVISPNPFTSEINISFNSKEIEQVKIEILDLTGRVIDVKMFNNTTLIQFSNNYKQGVYFMNVYGDGELITTEKVIKL